jgi:6-phosphogluconolactonase
VTDVDLRVASDGEEAARIVADELATAARAGGEIALAGGSTPGRAYELAASAEPSWGKAGVWWGDERCVEPGDPRSNYRLARESLFDRLARLPRAVHRIRGELGPEEAAARYDDELRGVQLDLVVLGIGTDGHTASLFPGSSSLDERERLAVPVEAPDVARVSLTVPALESAATVVFLAVGDDKSEAVERALARPPEPATPASLIRSRAGRTVAVLDRAAASRIT